MHVFYAEHREQGPKLGRAVVPGLVALTAQGVSCGVLEVREHLLVSRVDPSVAHGLPVALHAAPV